MKKEKHNDHKHVHDALQHLDVHGVDNRQVLPKDVYKERISRCKTKAQARNFRSLFKRGD